MKKIWLTAAALITAAGIALPGQARAFKRLTVGESVGDHTLATAGGQARRLSEIRGPAATVIVLWASWSPRSIEALRGVQSLLDSHDGQELTAVAVNVDGPAYETEAAAALQMVVSEAGGDMVHLVDIELGLYDAVGVVAVPSLILLDDAGRVAFLANGYSRSVRGEFADRTAEVLGMAGPDLRSPSGATPGYAPRATAASLYRMAQLYLRKHRTEQAVELLVRALAEDPLFAEARSALVAALRRAGRPDEAARLELAATDSEEYCLVPRRVSAAANWQ